jgi:hypothetical protein
MIASGGAIVEAVLVQLSLAAISLYIAARPPRQPQRVPQRLVRRVPRHPDPGGVRHPHPASPILPQPPQPPHADHAHDLRTYRRDPAVTPLAGFLGFATLPISFFLILLGMIATYLLLVELVKRRFYAIQAHPHRPRPTQQQRHQRHLQRRAARFTHHATHNRPRNRPGLGPG